MRKIVAAGFLIVAATAHAQGGAFAKLEFSGEIRVEVPRNWVYLDDNIKRHLNTGGEAAARLAGITPNPGENVILVAANAFTAFRTPSATLRLSVRRGENPSQSEIREVSKLSKAEMAELLAPVLQETRRVMIGVEGVKEARALGASIATNKGLMCMFFEFETDTVDGIKIGQTYVCPMGDKAVKLSTSYRKSEAAMFRPVVQYVWQSLSAR